MPDIEVCRGVWAAMESGRTLTVDDLRIIADVEPTEAAAYLNILIRHGYAALWGVRAIPSGDSCCLFRMINRTGPQAPYVDDKRRFVDPNRPGRQTGECRGKFTANVRLAAERMPGPFTSTELKAQLFDWPETRTRKFDSLLARLKTIGELIRDETFPDGRCWTYRPNSHTTAIRGFFRAKAGKSFDSATLKAMVDIGNAVYLRQSLDLLEAEGYRVTVTPVSYRVTEYTVEEPSSVPASLPGDKIPPNPPFSKGGIEEAPLGPPVNGGKQEVDHVG